LIAVEDLNLRAMVRSAKGTLDEPGTKVAQKRGLNRAIHDQAWGTFIRMLAYKAEEAGGRVLRVDPRHTSETCACCGERDASSRRGAQFRCRACGRRADADTNAANVILIRALAKLGKEQQQGQGPDGAFRRKLWRWPEWPEKPPLSTAESSPGPVA
jgi:putative transposase